MFEKVPVVIVAAMSRETRVMGNQNGLLWHLPKDLRRFKTLTAQHPVVMGRKTFESIVKILGKPLPGRPNIVVTHNTAYAYPGITVVPSLEAGLAAAAVLDREEIHIGGGAEIYAQALPYVDRLYLTLVEGTPEGDVYFPSFEDQFAIETAHEHATENGITYQWVDYRRK